MKKGRHRRFEEARAFKRTSTPDIESVLEVDLFPGLNRDDEGDSDGDDLAEDSDEPDDARAAAEVDDDDEEDDPDDWRKEYESFAGSDE